MAVTRSKQASRYGTIDIHTTVGDWWQDVDVPYVAQIWNIVNPVRDNIIRIDIDCKLMPCATANTSCLYQVPAFINNLYGLNNVPLRIFSHADENMGGGGSSKRVVQCGSGAPSADLLTAYNDHDGWGWAP